MENKTFEEVKHSIENTDKQIWELEARIGELKGIKETLVKELRTVCSHGQTREIWFAKVKFDSCLLCGHTKKFASQHWSPPKLRTRLPG